MAKALDWAAIRLDYEAGIKSLKAMGKEYGCSDVAIFKRAKKDGWARDLSKRIEARAAEKVSKAAVSAAVSDQRSANEQMIVEANATMQAQVILSHREDVRRARVVVGKMMDELEQIGAPKPAKPPVEGAVAVPLLSLSERALVAQRLTSALSGLIDKERQAFGIDKMKEAGSSWMDAIAEL